MQKKKTYGNKQSKIRINISDSKTIDTFATYFPLLF